ncbi:variable surface protein [Plasmodium gonderi]|uniref:Variable surface protein n=1 Tax=Plasmodium gonderi TaxID=77519 RepID=A0A1Y1JQI5_PLAGO|nr:variable surface protein [Plasmodium gonderi]GAW84699.1 variable surface protein [Plasmodium gonderi]
MTKDSEMNPEPDFRDIFPHFSGEYNDAIYYYGKDNLSWLSDACTKFCTDVTGGRCNNFIIHCTNFGRFLYYINLKKYDKYTKQRCKYYFYKFMFELGQKGIDCGGIKSCYEKMIEKLKISNYLKDNPSCEAYFEEFDKRYLVRFSKLDKISDYIHKLRLKYYDTCWSYIYRECDELTRSLMSSECNGKRKFYDMLANVVNTYYILCPDSKITLPPYIEHKKNKAKMTMSTHSQPDGTMEQTSHALVTIQSFEEVPDNAFNSEESERILSNEMPDSENSPGVISGFFISLFIIFSILFILSKYTNFYSVLQSRIRRIRRIFDRKYSEHKNFMYSLKRESRNTVYDSFQIAYRSNDYQ